jgi:iron complex transport system substrate-binding protein
MRSTTGARVRLLPRLALASLLLLAGTTPVAAQDPISITDADGNVVAITDTSRVATLGGVFTETAYALGAQDQVAAVDASSYYPPQALAEKPNFGYYRFLSAEPVLAQAPSLIIGNEETGPPEVVAQLRDAGVPILLLPDNNDIQAARDLIATLGTIFGKQDKAAELIATLDADIVAAQELVTQATSRPRVLFILQPPEAPTLVAGGDIPMTPEGIVEIAPDIILTTDASLERFGGREAFLAAPGIAQTPAAQAGRVVSMEDLYLLGFGPRTGRAIAHLARLLHPELAP